WIDDSFISFRYARNWAEGRGLIFNPGERVEGYTDFSFVAFEALCFRLGLDPDAWTRLVNAAMAVLLVFGLARLAARGPRPRRRLPVSALLLVPLPAFAYWATSNMETMLFTALLSSAVLLGFRESASGAGRGAVCVFVLLALTRPEGVLCFALCTAVFVLAE